MLGAQNKSLRSYFSYLYFITFQVLICYHQMHGIKLLI